MVNEMKLAGKCVNLSEKNLFNVSATFSHHIDGYVEIIGCKK
jgi:hypothetical protein